MCIMFLKPFRVKTKTSVKSSDRKKLRSDIQQSFPSLTEEDVLKLLPQKEEMTLVKINTHADENIVVYTVGKNPLFFENFKILYPTVYTLWQFPEILQAFRTWPPVYEKLQKGADLMLPGVVPDNEPSPKMFGKLQKGDLVSIKIAGNKSPVAIGKALLSGEDMYMSAMRGKGVSVLHIMGDTLWEMGDKSRPPMIPETLPNSYCEEEVENTKTTEETDQSENTIDNAISDLKMEETEARGACSCGETSQNDVLDESDEERNPTEQMDDLLNFCFACALKSKIKKNDLPLLTGNLLRNYMQPFSGGKQLDLKKSSFKKLSKFLQSKVNDGYIVVKEQSKGVDVITEIDKTHPGVRDIQVPDIVEAAEAISEETNEDGSYQPLTFTDVYLVNAATLDLFKESGICKGDALQISDVRQHVINYIKTNNLQKEDNPKLVTLDPILAHIILKPVEGDLDQMNWEQVINRVVGKMQAGVAISSGSRPPTIKKTKIEPIKLEVVMRASQKKVTIVDNLEEYGLDLRVFSKLVQKSVACSCTIVTPEQKNKGPQVHVQGNQVNFVYNLLTEKYKIPKRYVTGLENAPKQKKR
ncbi:eukaryotic translation initiation factor 2D-like isoform X1 [Biomphalaria glabrata]|uniref:Eukaryotic translation initiation factor 2D-like isoform X1 n=2 Tax=Biomphalaria glabrata TaxID=6526 RepID=A0A9U8E5B8_BIOGL|nr:eukaryotic translation initiation factor 2D-like isoform X1 [Biomphalaria glabrata]